MGDRGRDVPRRTGGGFFDELTPLARLALITGAAVLAALLLSMLLVATHQFAYAIQLAVDGWK